ncbi:MAG: response regulator transcription factor [Myxococcota bacterium]
MSNRQRQVADLAASGLTVPEMARHLDLSPHTVRDHLRVAYRRLGVANRVELVRTLKG